MGNIFERLGLQIGNRRNRKRIPFSALQWSKSTNVEKYEKKRSPKITHQLFVEEECL